VSTVTTAPRRSVLRVRVPLGLLALLAGGYATVWNLPASEFWTRMMRVQFSMGILAASFLVVSIWWFCFSGISWLIRLALPAALVGAVFACVDGPPILDGDMVPVSMHFRWQPNRADVYEAYRQAHPASNSEAPAPSDEIAPDDYPGYRNRNRDGVVTGPTLARDWNAKPPRQVWKHPCGGGFAGFAVAAGRAVTIEQRRADEAVVCYDAATGNEIWSHSYPARFYDSRGGEGPMATPTIDRGLVFSLGGTGRLVCLDFATGELKWGKDLLKPGENLTWGMSGSPLVYDDFVVVNPGCQGGRSQGTAVIAFNRKTGKEEWSSGVTPAGYSSPMLVTFDDKRQLVIFDGVEVAGYDDAGREKLWACPWRTQMGINVAQPLVLEGNRLFITSGYGVGCGIVAVGKVKDGWEAVQQKHAMTMQGKFASPVEYKGLVYGLSEGVLTCVDPNGLTKVWSGARYGHGQLLRCEDLLIVLSERGELVLAEAAGPSTKELGRVPVLAGDKTWNPPCIAGGKAYVRNHVEMACYNLRD
jgi:outer membrane protein assembly factor BamB